MPWRFLSCWARSPVCPAQLGDEGKGAQDDGKPVKHIGCNFLEQKVALSAMMRESLLAAPGQQLGVEKARDASCACHHMSNAFPILDQLV